MMEEDYELIKENLTNAKDEVIISGYLKRMVVHGHTWPEHFIEDVDVFNKNPNEEFESESPTFVIVKPRTEKCGKTDGCESGCWRIMASDKLIKSEETGKILGFKKILKFCVKNKPREYKRTWIMEEYRLADKLNWKQDHVICKIRLLFGQEISFFLTKQFSSLTKKKTKQFSYLQAVPTNQLLLPVYGFSSADPDEEDAFSLLTLMDYDGNKWPSHVTNDVYRLHPLSLVDLQDQVFRKYGACIFANRKETSGKTDECDDGCWRIMKRDRLIKSNTGNILGFKRVFKFLDKEGSYVCEGEDVKVTWTMEEYRLVETVMENKVLCVIKLKVLS